MTRRPSWHGQRLTLRWCDEIGQWALRRGAYRIASSEDWPELYGLCLRIAHRERREARKLAYITSK